MSFLIWRVFIFESARGATNIDRVLGGYHSLVADAIYKGLKLLEDFIQVVFMSWMVGPLKILHSASFSQLALSFLAMLAASLVFYWWYAKMRQRSLTRSRITAGLCRCYAWEPCPPLPAPCCCYCAKGV